MYVVVHHTLSDPQAAFARGEQLIRGGDAPSGVRVLQFYPSRDSALVTCLWESPSVEAVQDYVDETLGDASENRCYEVAAEAAFAERPAELAGAPAPAAAGIPTSRR